MIVVIIPDDPPKAAPAKVARGRPVNAALPYREAKEAFDRGYFDALLRKHGGNVTRTAEAAGLDRASVSRKVAQFNLKGN
jgi:two-component system nitrogen regulation response regulator NtrX